MQFLPRRLIVDLCDLDAPEAIFQLHLLAQERISRRNCLDLCIGENGLVHILQRTQGASARHDLRNLLLLVLDRLPEVGVKRALCHVAIDFRLVIAIAGANDAPHALLKIGRTPRHRKIMQRSKPVLYVCPDAECPGRTDQHTNCPAAHLVKEFLLILVRDFLHNGNFFARDSALNELLANIVIDIEAPFPGACRSRLITENNLCAVFCICCAVGLKQVLYAAVHFAVRRIPCLRINKTRIKRQGTSCVCDEKHTVLRHRAVHAHDILRLLSTNIICAIDQIADDLFLLLRCRCLIDDNLCGRDDDITAQHIGSPHIGKRLEARHEFRQIAEIREPLFELIAAPFGLQLHADGNICKRRSPRIEALKPEFLQAIRSKIALHGVDFRHGVGDRRPGRKDQPFIARNLIDILRLHVEIPCLLHMVGRADAGNAGVTGHHLEILELVRLINDEFIYTKLLKGNHVIHPFAVLLLEFFQPVFLIGDELCNISHREIFRGYALCPERKEFVLEFVNGTLPHCRLTLCGQLDLFKRRCTDHNSIPVLRRNARNKLLPIFLLEVLLLCDQNLRARIEPLEFLSCLRSEMIRNDHERLVGKPHTLCFHDGCNHLKGLSCTNTMCKERIAAEQAVRDRILLMRL